MGAEEARINQALLTSLLEARKAGELDAKVSELLAILKGGATMRSHHDLWKRVQRSLTSDSLGRTAAGLVLAEVDRLDLGSLPLWTDAELEALKRPLVRDS